MRFSGLLSIRGLHAAAGRRVRELAFCRDEGRAAGLAAGTAGAITIAIATPPHRAAMRARMAAYCNPAGTRARGDLVVLDADEMLRLFLIGSHPDPGGLDLIIGGLIRRAATAGRPVRRYGEMVALLCGYPARAVSATRHAAALQEICDLHETALGPAGHASP
jgi:hypothetical protein